MSLWALLFIGLAISMAVGPIMLMQPSRRDRYLAELRQQAAKSGLCVHMTKYFVAGSSETVAVYGLPVNLPAEALHWQLIRRNYSHDIHFHGQWEWQVSPDLSAEQQALLRQLLDDLPSDVVGLEFNGRNIGIWWQEKRGNVSVEGDIKVWLERCHRIIC